MENTCKLVSVKSKGRPSVKISHIVPTSFLAMWECVRVVYTNPRVYAAIKPSLESLTKGLRKFGKVEFDLTNYALC